MSFTWTHNELGWKLRQMEKAMEDPSEVLDSIGELMISSVDKTFVLEGRPEAWAPLALMSLLTKHAPRKKGFREVGKSSRSGATLYEKRKGSRYWRDAFKKRARTKGVYTAADLKKGVRKKMEGNKILQGPSAILLNSIDYDPGDWEVTWGTNLIYAATHNFGDPTRNIPQREFITEPFDEDWRDIEEILIEWVGLK